MQGSTGDPKSMERAGENDIPTASKMGFLQKTVVGRGWFLPEQWFPLRKPRSNVLIPTKNAARTPQNTIIPMFGHPPFVENDQ